MLSHFFPSSIRQCMVGGGLEAQKIPHNVGSAALPISPYRHWSCSKCRSDEVPAKLCNETALQPLVNTYLTRAHSDIN